MKREPLSPDFFKTFLFFDKPVAPVYLRLLCWIYMGLAVIGSLIYGINALRIARFAGGFEAYLFVMISTLLVLFVSVTLIRLVFDWAILFFNKNEYLKKITEQQTPALPAELTGTPRQQGFRSIIKYQNPPIEPHETATTIGTMVRYFLAKA